MSGLLFWLAGALIYFNFQNFFACEILEPVHTFQLRDTSGSGRYHPSAALPLTAALLLFS